MERVDINEFMKINQLQINNYWIYMCTYKEYKLAEKGIIKGPLVSLYEYSEDLFLIHKEKPYWIVYFSPYLKTKYNFVEVEVVDEVNNPFQKSDDDYVEYRCEIDEVRVEPLFYCIRRNNNGEDLLH